ncbi:fibroblast growth factor 22 isoform X1 [Mesocricetus auratus]|uniref:Fibroblast growth factor n=1 Tax=Mesocricetus auratus TaxID=10036 RepID=A0A1U8CG73_MESAU|nr:fibroblast growth factor 22 isoform X1 [Mesocricetus auratus]
MRRRLWLGLAWLLLARAPGAAGGYPHLEGDVRWRRLFSSTHFFLRVDPGGQVQGTRWRHGQDSIVEIRSVRVGTVVIKAVYSGFYVAMNRRGRLYGSVPGAHRGERLQHIRFTTLAAPRPTYVPGTGRPGRSPARQADTAAPALHTLPASAGLVLKGVEEVKEAQAASKAWKIWNWAARGSEQRPWAHTCPSLCHEPGGRLLCARHGDIAGSLQARPALRGTKLAAPIHLVWR